MDELLDSMTCPTTLNFRGRLLSLDKPLVMGILNLTPDSFSDGGRFTDEESAMSRISEMLEEGADIIDLGAASSRPGASPVAVEEEWNRLCAVVGKALANFPDAIFSVDTYRSQVASKALELGVHAINDISGGRLDPAMIPLVAKYRNVPYFIMHMRGNPATMQSMTDYGPDVVAGVMQELRERILECREAGMVDLVVDPGFGFSKTLEQNYALLRNLHQIKAFRVPLLVGISRKSMVYKVVGGTPDSVGDLTAALHFQALEHGANILRVHDVKETVRLVKLHRFWKYGIV
jgi:dihydropteroate synthase